MSNHTSLIFILDRSGSMQRLTQDTIGGYNTVLEENKKADGTADVTLVLFDHEYMVVYDHVDIQEVEPLTSKVYQARGMTALLDAIGRAVSTEKSRQKAMPKDERPDKTIVTIITDGEENDSKEYSYASVSKLLKKVQNKKKRPWVVTFLGANLDVAKEASKLGIRQDRAQSYMANVDGTKAVYSSVAKMSMNLRAAKVASFADEASTSAAVLDGLSDVREDYDVQNK